MFKHDLGNGTEVRMFELRHAPAFQTFVAENRAHLFAWLGWADAIKTREDAEGFIKRGITRFAEDGLPWIGIWHEGALAGGMLFFPLERAIRATEIGYWLGQSFVGRGIMTRAIRAVLPFVFDDLQINRLGLLAAVENAESRSVAERLGFKLEGIRRDGWVNHGERIDMAVYSLLAREWRAQSQSATP